MVGTESRATKVSVSSARKTIPPADEGPSSMLAAAPRRSRFRNDHAIEAAKRRRESVDSNKATWLSETAIR